MDEPRVFHDLERTLNIMGYRYQPDLHGYEVSSSYEGTATGTSRRVSHGAPSTDALESELKKKLEIMNMPKSMRRAELMIKNASAHRFKNGRTLGESWMLSQKDVAWSFVMYTLRGALDRLARLFDPRQTIGAGACIMYPRCFEKHPVSEKVQNLRGKKPSPKELRDLEQRKESWYRSRDQLMILCPHLYEVIHSLEACQRGIKYWVNFGGNIDDILFLENTITYLRRVCIDIHASCPKKKQNIKRVELNQEKSICQKIQKYRYPGSVFDHIIVRLLRSRTRLPETRALYLAHVKYSNSLLSLLHDKTN